MSARIQDTFDLPVSDECGCSDARMVTQETNSASQPTGVGASVSADGARQTQPTEQECAADYFLQQGERDRLDRAIRDRLNGGK